MNYFYDILINVDEDNIFKFYEWENYDPIEIIKKIPLFRVNTNTLIDFYSYNIKVSQDFLNRILDKTLIKNNKINKTLRYACLLCDSKNTLILEFNDEGNIIGKSSLLLDDELNVLECIYNYNLEKIEYEKLNKRIYSNKVRQEEIIKKVINVELQTLEEKNNISKLKYLFNEVFGYEEDDFSNMKKKMENILNIDNNEIVKKIYNLIILSYNKS